MSVTLTFGGQATGDLGSDTKQFSVTADEGVVIKGASIPYSANPNAYVHFRVSIPVDSRLQAVWMSANGADLSVEVNSSYSSGASADINLPDGEFRQWASGQGSSPLGNTAVTDLYVFNKGSADATFEFKAVFNK